MEELGEAVQDGFAKAMWCGDRACEDKIKDEFNASSRNMPFDQEGEAKSRATLTAVYTLLDSKIAESTDTAAS